MIFLSTSARLSRSSARRFCSWSCTAHLELRRFPAAPCVLLSSHRCGTPLPKLKLSTRARRHAPCSRRASTLLFAFRCMIRRFLFQGRSLCAFGFPVNFAIPGKPYPVLLPFFLRVVHFIVQVPHSLSTVLITTGVQKQRSRRRCPCFAIERRDASTSHRCLSSFHLHPILHKDHRMKIGERDIWRRGNKNESAARKINWNSSKGKGRGQLMRSFIPKSNQLNY